MTLILAIIFGSYFSEQSNKSEKKRERERSYQTENLVHSEVNCGQNGKEHTEWENIFAADMSTKELMVNIQNIQRTHTTH